jgi:hypothetical protein
MGRGSLPPGPCSENACLRHSFTAEALMFNMRLELQKKKLTATIFLSSILPAALIAICIFLYAMLIVDKEYKRVSASELETLSGGIQTKGP